MWDFFLKGLNEGLCEKKKSETTLGNAQYTVKEDEVLLIADTLNDRF